LRRRRLNTNPLITFKIYFFNSYYIRISKKNCKAQIRKKSQTKIMNLYFEYFLKAGINQQDILHFCFNIVIKFCHPLCNFISVCIYTRFSPQFKWLFQNASLRAEICRRTDMPKLLRIYSNYSLILCLILKRMVCTEYNLLKTRNPGCETEIQFI
jgi:hypothetical protein